ncbi:MAG: hypothetical protein QOI77_1953 [Blastocatellia bacterium]|nr:hypothetical protein [Blastocatellia bacterium]
MKFGRGLASLCTDAQLARPRGGQAARATGKRIDKMYARAACARAAGKLPALRGRRLTRCNARAACACAAGKLAAPGKTMYPLANR